ncbi:hypothetical protein [Paenibacillus chitinolyticus]|uniref:hypothetical protein n=1 Tax=Paenibacillus chitinolyticus TaxID=79263 RepID=UPI003D011817
MAIVKCGLCAGNVKTTAKNYVFANEIHQHKKCPKAPVLTEQEIKDRKELTDAIQWASINKNLNEVGKDGVNWALVSKQIKSLQEQGYSFTDQIYGFKWLVERDGGFWGYGRLEKFIAKALEQKRREDEFFAKKASLEQSKDEKSMELKVVSKPTFMDGIGDDDLSWL